MSCAQEYVLLTNPIGYVKLAYNMDKKVLNLQSKIEE